jgi:hypothetical protein
MNSWSIKQTPKTMINFELVIESDFEVLQVLRNIITYLSVFTKELDVLMRILRLEGEKILANVILKLKFIGPVILHRIPEAIPWACNLDGEVIIH